MQPNENPGKIAGTVTHPSETEWMEFLYEEMPPSRKCDLGEHLRGCSECAAQVETWRKGMAALDTFEMRSASPAAPWWRPAIRWAAAAAMILFLGFVLGRTTAITDSQLRELRATVSRLDRVAQQHPNLTPDGVVAVATQAAGEETLRIMDEYTRVLDQQNARDRQATAVAVRGLETRINTLRAELETVAVNTQDGLQTTHQNLAQLVLFSSNPERPSSNVFNQESQP